MDNFFYRVFFYPSFNQEGKQFKKASFWHLVELYDKEFRMPVKIAHKLKHRILFPGPIERQSVQFTDAVFCESTLNGLLYYGKKDNPEFLDTAELISIILKWWKTVNSKSLYSAKQKRDSDREVITKENIVEKTTFLRAFVDWLSEWEATSDVKNRISAETFQAARHSSACLADVAEYLLVEEEFTYVTLGKLQSDPIEGRFGRYRQMTGGNLYASVRQIVESERSIKVKNLAKLNLSLAEIKDIFSSAKLMQDSATEQISCELVNCLDCVNDLQVCPNIPEDDSNILFYVGGAFSRKIERAKKCDKCKKLLVADPAVSKTTQAQEDQEIEAADSSNQDDSSVFLSQVNRGGLTIPSEIVFLICAHTWEFYNLIIRETHLTDLLYSPNLCSRTIFTKAFFKYLDSFESTRLLFLVENCENGHPFCDLVASLVQRLFNLFSKNHAIFLNSEIHIKKNKRSNDGSDVKRESTKLKVAKLQSDVIT